MEEVALLKALLASLSSLAEMWDGSPFLAKSLIVMAGIQLLCKYLCEPFFGFASALGDVPDDDPNAKWAKPLGRACWLIGRCIGGIGYGTSKRFIEAQYLPKPTKQSGGESPPSGGAAVP